MSCHTRLLLLKSFDGLRDRIRDADFPYVSANIRATASGAVPDFATPFVVEDVQGVRVGIVGLTTTTRPA